MVQEQSEKRVLESNIEESLSTKGDIANAWKVLAVLCMLIFSALEYRQERNGNAVFLLMSSIFTFCSINPLASAKSAFGSGSAVAKFARALADSSFMDLYRRFVLNTRRLFYYGDVVVRIIMSFLALGASALLIKQYILNLQLLFPPLDLYVKRLGPTFAISIFTVYPTYLISKLMYGLSENAKDKLIRKYEFPVYVSCILVVVTTFILFCGVSVEDWFPSSHGDQVTRGWEYLPEYRQMIIVIDLIWFLWWLAFLTIVFLRVIDFKFRQMFESKTATQNV